MPKKKRSRSPAKTKNSRRTKTKLPRGYFSKEYRQFIKSPQWKKKRQQVLIRDRFTCQHCGSRQRLEVDHQTYPARGASFQDFVDQPNDQLLTLCHECHVAKTEATRSGKPYTPPRAKSPHNPKPFTPRSYNYPPPPKIPAWVYAAKTEHKPLQPIRRTPQRQRIGWGAAGVVLGVLGLLILIAVVL